MPALAVQCRARSSPTIYRRQVAAAPGPIIPLPPPGSTSSAQSRPRQYQTADNGHCPSKALLTTADQARGPMSQGLQSGNQLAERLRLGLAAINPFSSAHDAICRSIVGSHRVDAKFGSHSHHQSQRKKQLPTCPHHAIDVAAQLQEPLPA